MNASCPACHSPDSRPAFEAVNRREGNQARGTYRRCERCGTLRLDGAPEGSALQDAYASGEIDSVSSGEVSVAERRQPPLSAPRQLARAARTILFGRPHAWPERRVGRGRILDFGCLDGSKLVDFYQRGWEVAGVDLNRAGIERARKRMPDGFFHAGPIEELPGSETFDVIRTDNVLEHIPEPLGILRHLRTRLRPGGLLLVYVPSGESLSVRLFGERSVSAWVPYHLTLFSKRGLERLLGESGFERTKVTPFSPPDWWRITARQLVAEPGFMGRPPGPVERAAGLAQSLLSPALLALSRTPLAEEWVAQAFAPA